MTYYLDDKTIRINEEQYDLLKTKGIIEIKNLKGVTVGTNATFEGYDSLDVVCVRVVGMVKSMDYNSFNKTYELNIKVNYTESINRNKGEEERIRTHYLELDVPQFRRAEEYKSITGIPLHHIYAPNDIIFIREHKHGKLTENMLKARIGLITMNGKGTIKAKLD